MKYNIGRFQMKPKQQLADDKSLQEITKKALDIGVKSELIVSEL